VVTGLGLVDNSLAPSGNRFHEVRSIEISFYRNIPFPVRLSPNSERLVIQSAEFKDLALLILNDMHAPLAPARLGSASVLSAGDAVESVGHLDVDWDWTQGVVRTVGELIRHSSEIGHGSSGGPLFNTSGEVVGINLQTIQGVARAIAIDEALSTIQRWIEPQCLPGGVIRRPPEPPPPPPPVASAPPPVRPPPPPPVAGQRMAESIAGVEFAWRYIPPGTFRMGSPADEIGHSNDETLHEVTLTRAFWMAETEVTQGQWRALMENNPAEFRNCGAKCPIERVTWYDALAFANELARHSKLEKCYVLSEDNGKKAGEGLTYRKAGFTGPDCKGYRLPTEAEWEYAARAQTETPFFTGDDLTTDQANYDGNHPYAPTSQGAFLNRTVEVRRFGSNPWKLHDVNGNVWEWTQDFADLDETQKPELVVTKTYDDDHEDPMSKFGAFRIIRGGSWFDSARDCRAANRNVSPPDRPSDNIGFRLVRTLRP
jgi:formylglycine-generating enzyme required for sulfatase activity